MESVSQQIQKDIDKLLSRYDKDGDQTITKKEAVDFFKKAGNKYPERSANNLFCALDKNQDGKITSNEIKADLIQMYASKIENAAEIDVQTFISQFDFDNDKKITFDEMVKYFKDSGSEDGDATANYFFREIDTDKDGVITFEEVKKYSIKNYGLNPTE